MTMELQSVWGWQPALYLFLGGMGAGAFVTAALLYLREGDRHRRIVCGSMGAAALSLAFGLLLLLMELATPARGLLMWQSFANFGSWMTYGAWAAFGAMGVFGASALLAARPVSRWLRGRTKWYAAREDAVRKALAVAGIGLGLFVACYTGMLLMAPGGVPLWSSPLLPALFTVSALDTGVALVEIVAATAAKGERLSAGACRALERAVVVLVLLEAVVLTALVVTSLVGPASTATGLAAAASAEALAKGSLAPWFWLLVVGGGLAVPFGVALRGVLAAKRQDSVPAAATSSNGGGCPAEAARERTATLVGAVGALVGGCALRFVVLAAGVHADLVGETIVRMIG